jgi:hypothetical protein
MKSHFKSRSTPTMYQHKSLKPFFALFHPASLVQLHIPHQEHVTALMIIIFSVCLCLYILSKNVNYIKSKLYLLLVRELVKKRERTKEKIFYDHQDAEK